MEVRLTCYALALADDGERWDRRLSLMRARPDEYVPWGGPRYDEPSLKAASPTGRRHRVAVRGSACHPRRPISILEIDRPLAGDDVAVAHRVVAGGELEQPVEDQPAASRPAPIEAEHELIQVALQMRLLDRPLMGAQQPPLGQRGDPVHSSHTGDLRPRPGRVLIASRSATFEQLATAIDDAFARWDRNHLHEFTLTDGTVITPHRW